MRHGAGALPVALLLLIALQLQTAAAPLVTLMGLKPQFVAALVVSLSVLSGPLAGATWGFVGGLALDLLSGVPLGVSSFALTMMGTIWGHVAAGLKSTGWLVLALAAFPALVAYDTLVALWLQGLGWPLSLGFSLVHVALPGAMLSTLPVPFNYYILRWLEERSRRFEVRSWD